MPLPGVGSEGSDLSEEEACDPHARGAVPLLALRPKYKHGSTKRSLRLKGGRRGSAGLPSRPPSGAEAAPLLRFASADGGGLFLPPRESLSSLFLSLGTCSVQHLLSSPMGLERQGGLSFVPPPVRASCLLWCFGVSSAHQLPKHGGGRRALAGGGASVGDSLSFSSRRKLWMANAVALDFECHLSIGRKCCICVRPKLASLLTRSQVRVES